MPESANPWGIVTEKCVNIVIVAWGIHMGFSTLINIVKIKEKVVEFCKNRLRKTKVEPSSNIVTSITGQKDILKDYRGENLPNSKQ